MNLIANIILLLAKAVVMSLTSSMSVLASLVDGALDFLSTAIVWTTSILAMEQDRYRYPVGRRRLGPMGILIFSVIMVSSFFQVALVSLQRLTSSDHSVISLTIPAIGLMAGTVVVKFLCWLWCRFVKNSSVQALAQDAMTDMVFNSFSIMFPLGKFTLTTPRSNWLLFFFFFFFFFSLFTNYTVLRSWRCNQCLVRRPSRWSFPFHLHHVELGQYYC